MDANERKLRAELVEARADLAMRDARAMRRLSWVLSVAEIKAKALHAVGAGVAKVYSLTGD